MKIRIIFFLVLGCVLLTTAGPGPELSYLVGNPGHEPVTIPMGGDRPLQSFLGDPRAKIDRIKQILQDAGRQILLERGFLNDAIGEILQNESQLVLTRNNSERRRLLQQNIGLFRKVENIRLKIARIQLAAQQRVLAVETEAYQRIERSVRYQLDRLDRSPAEYWIQQRKQLISPNELKSAPGDDTLRKKYR